MTEQTVKWETQDEEYWFNLIDSIIVLTNGRTERNDLERLKSLEALLRLYIMRIETIRKGNFND